jgi:serine phosphatase RsbU (regulator of sigma subunit)
MRYANAGHDLPYQRNCGEVVELLATGMPLGLMPDMHYEECEVQISHGESILFYSDGLVEAHNPTREMFGFPRLKTLLASSPDPSSLIDGLLSKLKDFTGTGWEQEDDVTMVTLERTNQT